MWKCWSEPALNARDRAGPVRVTGRWLRVATLGLPWCALVMAAPAQPEADSGSRLVWVPAAVAEGGAAQSMRLTLWPLRDPTTGDRNLDALQDLPSLPADAARPLDGHARHEGDEGDPGLSLPRAWTAPSALGPADAARPGAPLLDAAAELLPALSRRQLFGGAELVLSETRMDLPTDPPPRVAWQAMEPPATGAHSGMSVAGLEHGSDHGSSAEGTQALRHPARINRAWLDWPGELFHWVRASGLWLLLGLAALVGLGYALKAYSRRI